MITDSKWIWHEGEYDKNEYVDFIFDVWLDMKDEKAEFYISVDSEYELWINSKFVNCGQYDDFPENKVYDTLNVGKFLKKCKNKIAITAYYQGEYSFQYAKGERGISFALKNFNDWFHSSDKVLSRVSKTYQNGEIFKTTRQLGFGFQYDARNDDRWQALEYVHDSDWGPSVIKNIQTELQPRPIQKNTICENTPAVIYAQGYFKRENVTDTIAAVMHQDYLSHRKFEDIFDGEKSFPITYKGSQKEGIYLVIDLGKETCGFLSLSINTNCGTFLDIGYGEHLDDLRVRTEIEGRNFANTYICKEGKQSFTYRFRRIAGRYIEVHISNYEEISIDYIGVQPVMYPVEESGKFVCADSLHNKIFETCVETLKLCMHEHYEDCPWREQALYSFDSRNQALFGYYAFNEYQFPKASIDLLGGNINSEGYVSICAPTDEIQRIPSFSFMWLLEVCEYTEFSGDMYLVEKYWKQMKFMVDAYAGTMENGLVVPPGGEEYWNFYEWSEGYDGMDESIKALREESGFCDGVYNLMFYLALKEMISLAEKIEDKEFVDKYQRISEEIKTTFHNVFWNDKEKLYSTYKLNDEFFHYGELTQALALYTGIYHEEICNHLCNALLKNDSLVEITLSYAIFKYEGLIKHNEKYAKTVFDDIAKNWGAMLYQGATTFWETKKGSADFDYAGSLCHGWSATPLYMYFRYIAGISSHGKLQPNRDVFPLFSAEVKMRDEIIKVEHI